MQKNWNISKIDLKKQNNFSQELGISPIIAQILLNRQVNTLAEADFYLNACIDNCFDPLLLKDMEKSVLRIRKAIKQKEKIFIYGDYDVDGLTSCALLFFVLKDLGADVYCYIPHRVEEGYGLNQEACAYLKAQGAGLIITVDCGISSFKETGFLNSQGIDIIITDHHQPREHKIPAAYAVINPWQKDCQYPFKELAGVGIAYKLAQTIAGKNSDVYQHLDLVALGTISDVATLVGENRILVKEGLGRLSQTKKIGLQALIEITGISKRKLSSYHVGFILGPRINATGRMGSAQMALDLLLTRDYVQALKLAQNLDRENKERQKEEAKTLRGALAMIETQINFKQHRSLVLHNDDWHPGVIGIVASRIAERFYRPTILISTKDSTGKGSGRSIRNFHLFETLTKCGHLLQEFGGHEKAAGISILRENLQSFKEFFNEMAIKSLTEDDLIPTVDIDMEIDLSVLSEKLINEIEQCAPFGMGNPRPVFISRDLALKGRPKALRGNGFKMWVTDGKVTCEAFGSKFTDLDISHINKGFSIVYSPAMNEWQGISTIQLQLKDIRIF
ncbi:MAG: single-stranded-DNA-specific exonuclease RecJ [Candidatus Omnitrophota bacterium]